MLVRAFSRLRRRLPEARLLLLRPSNPDLERKYEVVEGLSFFEPVTDPHRLAQLYRQAWVCALTAYNEAFGLVLVEALAAGTPVVATNDGGIPEIVDRPEIGTLFARDDEDDLVRALEEGLELAVDSATAAKCRSRAEHFSVDRFVDAHASLYRDAMS